MLQREVAKLLKVSTNTVTNWELNRTEPKHRLLPAIVEFLGYNPLPEGESVSTQLVLHRKALGLSQKEMARRLGVNPGTLSRWERGERKPSGVYQHLLRSLRGRTD